MLTHFDSFKVLSLIWMYSVECIQVHVGGGESERESVCACVCVCLCERDIIVAEKCQKWKKPHKNNFVTSFLL